jgi:hypothetical protein
MESERKRNTHNSWGSINGPCFRGRVGLTLKLDKLLGPSMTFEVKLIKMKYLCIHNISIHIIFFYQNRFINECVRKNFLKRSFFVICRTYVLNKYMPCRIIVLRILKPNKTGIVCK